MGAFGYETPFRSSSTARFSELYILGRLRGCGASDDRTDWEHCAKADSIYSLYLGALAEMSEVFLISGILVVTPLRRCRFLALSG